VRAMCIADRLVNCVRGRLGRCPSSSLGGRSRMKPFDVETRTLLSGANERMDSAGLLHCLYVNIP